MKTCNVTGCNNPVWSKGMCQKHIPKTLLKKATYKGPPKGVSSRHVAQRRNDFFNFIWNKRPHVCQICNRDLGSEPLTYMFDHLLEKSKYPELMWEPDNILLVCLECHDKKTRGIVGEKYREKINFVVTKFNVS